MGFIIPMPPQKVIDIFPPQKSKEYRPSLPREEVQEREKPIYRKCKRGGFLKKGLVLLVVFPIFIFVILHFFFVSAEIKIWPETEMLTTDGKITIDGKGDKLDLVSKVVPGKFFEVEKIVLDEFSSTGKSLKKAEGVIRLYNNYTVQNEVWQRGTRFVASGGKLFLSKNKINVPGAQMKNNKIIPSFVDIQVLAAEEGTAYNIGPSHFSIFVYRGTPKYTKFYGESFQDMKGGGEAFQVTKEDLESAENILTEKAKTESEAALKNKIPDGFVFSDKIIETKILEKSSSADVGSESEKFNFQVKIKSATISFKDEDVEDFALMSLSPQVPEGKELYRESLEMEYSPETFSFVTEKVIVQIKVSGKIYPQIDLDSLRKALAGKSLTEAGILLENQSEIARYEIQFSLPWLRNIPNKLEKIKIELKID